MSFLTAQWRKLIFANYPVDAKVLLPYLPAHTELDTWNGHPYVSLIGFLFRDVRLLRLRIPFHVTFEEVNLRFYVRRRAGNGEWRRGVVFIKEIVPKPAITFVANTLYGEAYETRPMHHRWAETAVHQHVEYNWRIGTRWQTLAATADKHPADIETGSEAEFITEHYWGYSKSSATKTTEYEVTHPRWQQASVSDYRIDVDFALNYGPRFAFLNDRTPDSVFLAEGSPITIEGKRTIA
ncbi:hypothetical protein CLV84_0290 [Neolewinella xylanilytica]|uniref:DUF2071 domain-containing protein n=1 Tax=Neolewinella xylanilytica TaxID=1514080 RepID=A0A2S6I786_9BACT|nr:DUF2071 domain-containing protein [Neolewinella xylanilytica]PPK87350.1 hypothetical protein CLV84_0290 [Neolewinella xylanilytica]